MPPCVCVCVCSLCCVFLAFKVDEYNLSLEQFVNMLAPHLIHSTSEYIISHEVGALCTVTHSVCVCHRGYLKSFIS